MGASPLRDHGAAVCPVWFPQLVLATVHRTPVSGEEGIKSEWLGKLSASAGLVAVRREDIERFDQTASQKPIHRTLKSLSRLGKVWSVRIVANLAGVRRHWL
jgi:hypothetical protein